MALIGLACGGGSGSGPTAPQQTTVDQIEARSHQLLNQERRDGSISELGFHDALSRVARAHSEAMRDQGFFGHVGPSGGDLRARLQGAGVVFDSAGENLVQVSHPTDPAGVGHRELMASAEHRENILDGSFTDVGVGVARRGDIHWITQIFISR